MTAKNLKFGSVTFCFEVYVYAIINGGFVLSSAFDQAGLWGAQPETGIDMVNCTRPSGQVRLGD